MPSKEFKVKHGLIVDSGDLVINSGNLTISGLTASNIVETDASKVLITSTKNTAYNKDFTTSGGLNGTLTTVARGDHTHSYLPLAGGTLTGDLHFGDNKHAYFGAGNDLKIYHDGADSYIMNVGSPLYIGTSDGQSIHFRTNNTAKWNIGSSGHFYPQTDSSYNIGTNTTKVATGYFDNIDTTKLSNLTSNGFVKTSAGDGTLSVDTTSYLPLSGGTLTGDLHFGDNDHAYFGTGNDLQIFHDGTWSYIKNNTGELILQSVGGVRFNQYVTDPTKVSWYNNTTEIASLDNAGNLQLDGTLSVDGTGNSYIQGNVGIGLTNPGYKLDVSGISHFDNAVYHGTQGLISWGSGLTAGNAFIVRGQSGQGLTIGSNGISDYLSINTSGLVSTIRNNSGFSNALEGNILTKSIYAISQWREVAQGATITTNGGTLENGGPTARNGKGRWVAGAGDSITLYMSGSWWTRAVSFTGGFSMAYDSGNSYYNYNLPDSFTVEKSTDGATWTNVDTVTSNTSWYFFSTNLSDAPYIKITINTLRVGQTTSAIQNIQVWDASNTGSGMPFSLSGQGDAIFIGGNVGIGTSTLTEKLEVAGNIKLGDNYHSYFGTSNDLSIYHDGSNSFILNTGSKLYVGTTDSQPLYFRTNNTTRWQMNTAGNLIPGTGSSYDIGSASVRSANIYSDNIDTPKIGNLTTNGFVKTSSSDGTLSIDTNTYITSSGVTYENLSANGDIGIGASQVPQGNHKYHSFSNGDVYYDDYTQPNYLRLFTENAYFDTFRFRTYSNVEYWDGNSWTTWSQSLDNLFDGKEDTGFSLTQTYKKFRFEISRSSGWPTTALFVLQTSWSDITTSTMDVILETWNGSSWDVKDSKTFSSFTRGINLWATSNTHDGVTDMRVTITCNWTNNSHDYLSLRRILFLSNYSGGQTLYPFSWNYNKTVFFDQINAPKLSNLTSNGFVKTSAGDGTLSVDTTSYLPLTGGTLTGDLHFGDNKYVYFGAGDDLAIYNNGTYSSIHNQTGYLDISNTSFEKISLYTAMGDIEFTVADSLAWKMSGTNLVPGSDSSYNIGTNTTKVATGYFDNIDTTKLSNLTSNGFVKTSAGDGTLSVDTNTYLTGNQTITLSGDVTGSGTTAITATVVDNSHNHIMSNITDSTWTSYAEPGIYSGGGTPTLASGVTAAEVRSLIGAGTSSTTGTVTSVSGTGTVSGLTLTGTVTTSGSLTLGGSIAIGSTANLPLITGTSGLLIAGAWGGNGSATTFSRSDHTHSYLPLSGGTLTGDLTINETSPVLTLDSDVSNDSGIVFLENGTPRVSYGYKGSTSEFVLYNWNTSNDVISFPLSSDIIKFQSTPTVGAIAVSLSNHNHDGMYEVPLTFSTGLTRSSNTITVNTNQNISKLANLTTNGFVKTSAGDGTLSVDTTSYMTSSAGATTSWVASRGQNLLSNGSALLGDNTNFSSFTFVGSKANYSPGSFSYYSSGTVYTDEFIPVDVSKKYKMSCDAKSLNGIGKYYMMTVAYDVDENIITASNHMYRANTLTTLAQDLNNGDTVVHLTDSSNWYNAGTAGVDTHLRSIILWNYTNSFGYTYPAETYSRNWYGNSWDPGAIVGNDITLNSSWSGGTVSAGTQLSNGNSGGTYKYNVMSGVILTTSWVNYSGYMNGVDLSGTNVSTKFAPGTAKIKIGWLMNYQSSGETSYWTNLKVTEDFANTSLLESDYYSQTELSTSGQSSVHWDNITNEPSFLTGNQTITLSGDVTGSGTTSIVVTVADDSHNHIISNVDGLQSALDGKQAVGNYIVNGGALGTPSSGTLTNCTFPTLNQDTTGNAATATTATNANKVANTFLSSGTYRVAIFDNGTLGDPVIMSSIASLTVNTSSGTLSATTFSGALSGNATTATKLQTARTIAGVSFDGSADISLNNNAITNGAGYIANLSADTTPQLGGNLGLNNKAFILESQTIDASVSTGNLCYYDGTNWKQADADAESTASKMLGIYLGSSQILTSGVWSTTSLTNGSIYYVSTTAGGITTTAPSTTGNIVRVVGYAISTTKLFFNPDGTFVEIA